MNEFKIAVHGIEPAKKKATEFVMTEIERTRTKGKLDSKRISAEGRIEKGEL